MQIDNAPDFDKKKHTILVDVISAHWRITPISSKEIDVIYTYIVDPKGNVPMWLVNPMTLKSTWKTLLNIKEKLPQSKWQHSTLANIKEINTQ